MRPTPLPSATVVVLNPGQIAQIARNADVDNQKQGGLDLINVGGVPDADLEALGLTNDNTAFEPANRPDPVDVITIDGRDLPVDQINRDTPPRQVFRGREFDLVA